ncbi:abortive infection family protein [Chitinophaga filiformis]|uniref:Abortive infection family protein n=1 Tax=Chitinophaga filiformis TaxID=104663 RepID=A0ABY4I8A0_CHIFI|nr:abortive infection family protein [Chitinophaga filiformis]UPK70961.1 abortive infection family protein [Chitinophaga filiformis]
MKKVIEQYGRWSELTILILRIEAHIESDFSNSLENAKSLLETIGKEICTLKGHTLNPNSTINGVLKNAFSVLGYSNTNLVNQISSALATIGQQVGELRNEIGITSHGRSLAEIRERNNRVNILTREFLINTVEIISCFLIRSFENENPRQPNEATENAVNYLEAEDFNEFWDDAFGEFQMGTYSYAASEILFNVDKQAYINEYNSFTQGETTEE